MFKFFKKFIYLKELIEGGARMHLNLPIDVLQERCRIYMEVIIFLNFNIHTCSKDHFFGRSSGYV